MNHDILLMAAKLIEAHGWENFHPFQILLQSKIDLKDTPLQSREQFLIQMLNWIDAQVIAQTSDVTLNPSAEDRLFDVFMTRFDALAPLKHTLKVILCRWKNYPGSLLVCAMGRAFAPLRLMHHARGTPPDFLPKIHDLYFLSAYHRVFKTWLQDDTVDLSSTMACLQQSVTDFMGRIHQKS